ncbi:MAG: hypothetical protein RSF77_06385, partial [Oscillospiraceae bacterium]
MKTIQRLSGLFLVLVLALSCLAFPASADSPNSSLTVLFTHDTHDHFLPVPAETGGEYGGYT